MNRKSSTGRALLHLGSRRHGADDIASGERNNLIVWNQNARRRAAPGRARAISGDLGVISDGLLPPAQVPRLARLRQPAAVLARGGPARQALPELHAPGATLATSG